MLAGMSIVYVSVLLTHTVVLIVCIGVSDNCCYRSRHL